MVSFWFNHFNFLKESTCAFKHTIQMECLWQSFVPFGGQIMGWLAWLGGNKFGELLLRRGIIEAPNAMRKICGDFHESAQCVTALPECSDESTRSALSSGMDGNLGEGLMRTEN